MTSLTAGDVVWVPFPHVEDNRRRARPALIAVGGVGPEGSLCWALMITSAVHEDWPGDVVLTDHKALNLPIPSKVRTAKIATIECGQATLLGKLGEEEWRAVAGQMRGLTNW